MCVHCYRDGVNHSSHSRCETWQGAASATRLVHPTLVCTKLSICGVPVTLSQPRIVDITESLLFVLELIQACLVPTTVQPPGHRTTPGLTLTQSLTLWRILNRHKFYFQHMLAVMTSETWLPFSVSFEPSMTQQATHRFPTKLLAPRPYRIAKGWLMQ